VLPVMEDQLGVAKINENTVLSKDIDLIYSIDRFLHEKVYIYIRLKDLVFLILYLCI